MNFKDLDKDELHRIASEGGKKGARIKAEKMQRKDMSFADVVLEETTYKDLKELYDGLMKSGKKGNVKAVETILKFLGNIEDKPTSLTDFIDENE